jgi:hypothetical protein
VIGRGCSMRETHVAGEKLFVDFAGRTGEVVDGRTGEIIPVQIFVAVLGASSFTYAEATWSQKLPDWIAARTCAPSPCSALLAQPRSSATRGEGLDAVATVIPQNLRGSSRNTHADDGKQDLARLFARPAPTSASTVGSRRSLRRREIFWPLQPLHRHAAPYDAFSGGP